MASRSPQGTHEEEAFDARLNPRAKNESQVESHHRSFLDNSQSETRRIACDVRCLTWMPARPRRPRSKKEEASWGSGTGTVLVAVDSSGWPVQCTRCGRCGRSRRCEIDRQTDADADSDSDRETDSLSRRSAPNHHTHVEHGRLHRVRRRRSWRTSGTLPKV